MPVFPMLGKTCADQGEVHDKLEAKAGAGNRKKPSCKGVSGPRIKALPAEALDRKVAHSCFPATQKAPAQEVLPHERWLYPILL